MAVHLFTCRLCGEKLKVGEDLIGQWTRCFICGGRMTVPTPKQEADYQKQQQEQIAEDRRLDKKVEKKQRREHRKEKIARRDQERSEHKQAEALRQFEALREYRRPRPWTGVSWKHEGAIGFLRFVAWIYLLLGVLVGLAGIPATIFYQEQIGIPKWQIVLIAIGGLIQGFVISSCVFVATSIAENLLKIRKDCDWRRTFNP